MKQNRNNSLIINGLSVEFDTIKLGQWQDMYQWSEFEKSSLSFCEEWLQGEERFERFTSGSTGSPKSILLQRSQLLHSVRLTANALALNSTDVALTCLNTAYIAGTMMLARSLTLGMKPIIVTPSSNPLEAVEDIDPIDFMAFVPLQLQTILDGARSEQLRLLHGAKAIIVGGAPVSLQLEEALQEIKAPVYSTYGMTETVSHIALKRLNGPQRSNYYQVFDEVTIGTDERQCLTIKSVLTQGRSLTTNDCVHLIDTHRFEWLGRADNVINSGGVKIQIEKLERQVARILVSLSFNYRFIIMSLPDERLGEQVVLLLECDSSAEKNGILNRLMKKMEDSVDSYERPKHIGTLESFPETPTGKVDRHACRNLYRSKDKDN